LFLPELCLFTKTISSSSSLRNVTILIMTKQITHSINVNCNRWKDFAFQIIIIIIMSLHKIKHPLLFFLWVFATAKHCRNSGINLDFIKQTKFGKKSCRNMARTEV
jgi:hypothetical protein